MAEINWRNSAARHAAYGPASRLAWLDVLPQPEDDDTGPSPTDEELDSRSDPAEYLDDDDLPDREHEYDTSERERF